MNSQSFPQAGHRWMSEFGPMCLGRIVRVTEAGHPLVSFAGSPHEFLQARSIVVAPEEARESLDGRDVVLGFDNGDITRPIILGFVSDCIVRGLENSTRSGSPGQSPQGEQKHLRFEAHEEITIACGKSSITLRKNGKVVIKGTELVSRASGYNKIRGGCVAIN